MEGRLRILNRYSVLVNILWRDPYYSWKLTSVLHSLWIVRDYICANLYSITWTKMPRPTCFTVRNSSGNRITQPYDSPTTRVQSVRSPACCPFNYSRRFRCGTLWGREHKGPWFCKDTENYGAFIRGIVVSIFS